MWPALCPSPCPSRLRKSYRDKGENEECFFSPVPLLRFLLQAWQQSVQTMIVAVQQPRRQLAQVVIVLLKEERKSQVAPRPDVFQNEFQHIFFHHPFELRHKSGDELHSDLKHRFSAVIFQHFVLIKPAQFLWRKWEMNHWAITYVRHATLSDRLLWVQDALHCFGR